MKRILIALFTFFAFWPSNLKADIFLYPTKHVNVLLVCGHGVDCNRAETIFNIAKDYELKTVNVSLDLSKKIEIPEDMTGGPEWRGAKWQLVTKDFRNEVKAGITMVFITPFPESSPSIDFEMENILGLSSDLGCVGKRDCLEYSKLMGSDKVASRIAIHELGHLLGSPHTPDGLMAPYAQENQFADGYSATSVALIEEVVSLLP